MQTYLVGGAVRDRLLGLPVRERDWVVVGARETELEALGYKRVGRSFPVFLHPESQEEYALARTEKKTAPGYHGFEICADETVSLEEDLARRDLTINAIAKDGDSNYIDPFNGRDDLANKTLRHVSDAFREDPVRVLRAARFAARFHELGFTIAAETLELMRDMAASGEIDALIPERVWKETQTALGETRPDVYFQVLKDCGALAIVFPELDALFGVPQPERWHPEIDTGLHTLMAVRDSAARNCSVQVRFAVLVHDLGKGTTPKSEWPSHRGHEERSVNLIDQLCDRISVPNKFRDLAIPVARYHGLCHRANELKPATLLKLLEGLDAFRRPERLPEFIESCKADARGRTGFEDDEYAQSERLSEAFLAARSVDAGALARAGHVGEALGEALRQARIAAIRKNQSTS